MPRPGVDGRARFVVGGAGMAQRHAMAMLHEIANEIDPARQLRRERDDANTRSLLRDDAQECRRL